MFWEMSNGFHNLTKVVHYRRLNGIKRPFFHYSPAKPESTFFFGLFKRPAKEEFWYFDGIDEKKIVTKEEAHYNECCIRIWFQGEESPCNWQLHSVEQLEDLIKKIEECSVNCKFSS